MLSRLLRKVAFLIQVSTVAFPYTWVLVVFSLSFFFCVRRFSSLNGYSIYFNMSNDIYISQITFSCKHNSHKTAETGISLCGGTIGKMGSGGDVEVTPCPVIHIAHHHRSLNSILPIYEYETMAQPNL